jgi:hypothetical protein
MNFLFDGYLMESLRRRVTAASSLARLADFQRLAAQNPVPAYLMAN